MNNIFIKLLALILCSWQTLCIASNKSDDSLTPSQTPPLTPRLSISLCPETLSGSNIIHIRQGGFQEDFFQQVIETESDLNRERTDCITLQKEYDALLAETKLLPALEKDLKKMQESLVLRAEYLKKTNLEDKATLREARQVALREGKEITANEGYKLPEKNEQLAYLDMLPAKCQEDIEEMKNKIKVISSKIEPLERLKHQLKEKEQ